ncbi:MAG TPA: ribosomal protein S18-alanine N-acetyltransferase [Vicinamibacterales bacterium]|nr:ribosomal protein S18-alanine N-acetyltransferase [Vicinamibacterales bacterium]
MADVQPSTSWYIEPLSGEQDLAGVLEVDELSFTRPWTRAMYTTEFLNRDTSRLYVLRTPEFPVAGYCAAWFVLDEVHINNLAVRPQCRRRGYGAALLRHVLEEGARAGARRATLEVRRSNEAARRLYERFGFRIAGVRRDYYTHPTEDALILWREEPAR